MCLLGARENICTAPFLDAQELHFRSTLKANVCIFLYISVRNFFPTDVVTFYLMGVGWGKAEWFLKVIRCLGLVKCFTIFYLDLNFIKFNYFLAFWHFHL